jgi:hypothetical protein
MNNEDDYEIHLPIWETKGNAPPFHTMEMNKFISIM